MEDMQCIYMYGVANMYTYMYGVATISRLLKITRTFCKRALKRDCILPKRPIFWRSLLVIATPYMIFHIGMILLIYERVFSYMKEACHIWISHVTYEWAMPRMNTSRHTWHWPADCREALWSPSYLSNMSSMSQVSHMNESCHVCIVYMSHMEQSYVTYEWFICHIWISHITRVTDLHVTKKLFQALHTFPTCQGMSQVSHMNESCHVFISYMSHMNESCPIAKMARHVTYEWVMSWMNESYVTYEWVM